MIELKPCPFCGNGAEIYADEKGIAVRCAFCGAMTEQQIDVLKTMGDKTFWGGKNTALSWAIERWNTRVPTIIEAESEG